MESDWLTRQLLVPPPSHPTDIVIEWLTWIAFMVLVLDLVLSLVGRTRIRLMHAAQSSWRDHCRVTGYATSFRDRKAHV